MRNSPNLSRIVVAWMLAAGTPAFAAQEVPPSPIVAEEAGTPGDILVIARKRPESILRVPVVTTVLSQETIDRNSVAELSDVAALTPGLVLGLAPLEVGTQVSIRGIGTTSLDPGIDQSVSLNLDGLQLSQGLAYSVGMFDMAQIEVLKGPQALFFGKNSPGGVIAIRTADPGPNLEVMARALHTFESDTWRGEAVFSGPISDTLGLRVAALLQDDGGYFHNKAVPASMFGAVAPAPRFGETKTLYLRGTAKYDPTSDFSARLKVNYTRDRGRDGAPFQLGSCPDGTENYTGVPFYGVGEDCRPDRTLYVVNLDPAAFSGIRNGGVPYTNITQTFGTLEMTYSVSPHLDLTSVSGYYDLKAASMIGGTYAGQAASAIAAQKRFSRRDFTQEFRLISDFSGPLNLTAGMFYQDGQIVNDIQLLGNTTYQFPALLADGQHDVSIKSISAFGQLRYAVASDFEVAAGVRWTNEKRRDDAATVDLFGVYGGVPGGIVHPVLPRLRTSNWSPELTLTWTPTEDLTVFGSLKQGYKSGSYNLIIPSNPGENNSFGDERVRGGEVGVKARLADRQVFTNLAFYYYDYQGLQVGANEAAEGGIPNIRTVNAGSAKSYGVDFDFTYVPHFAEGLRLNGAVSWNKARFTSFDGAPCYGGQTIGLGCNQVPVPVTDPADIAAGYYANDPVTGDPVRYQGQNLKDAPLPRAPEWQLSLGFDYEIPVMGGWTLGLGGNGQFSTKYLTVLGNRDDFYQDGFAKFDASIRLKSENDAWELALIGSNLTNRFTTGNCTITNYAGGQAFPGMVTGAPIQGPAGSDEVLCTYDRGRQVSLRLTIRPRQ